MSATGKSLNGRLRLSKTDPEQKTKLITLQFSAAKGRVQELLVRL